MHALAPQNFKLWSYEPIQSDTYTFTKCSSDLFGYLAAPRIRDPPMASHNYILQRQRSDLYWMPNYQQAPSCTFCKAWYSSEKSHGFVGTATLRQCKHSLHRFDQSKWSPFRLYRVPLRVIFYPYLDEVEHACQHLHVFMTHVETYASTYRFF